ncbi:Wall-associated receptor kinase-like [Quillaja saponaria]|uniref:Wall-associated receptor kinase-like n=1 Tax=Quillaja saponaria TaxID=32244 RepID=A0AAD7PR91_QUISA|nr:Wall-associated receptor kinase-like [Quillaja saponaria]
MFGFLLTALLLQYLPQSPCLFSYESSIGLSYNGGRIMTEPVKVSILWFGDGWQDSRTEVIRNAITSLTSSRYLVKDSEVPTLGNWWEIIRQYRDYANAPVTDTVNVGSECFYSGPQLNMTLDQVMEIGKAVFSETSIGGFGGNLTCTQAFEVDDNTIYHVVFSHTVLFLDGRKQRGLTETCSPPNADEKIDSLVGLMLARIAEEVTNGDGRGWMSNDGNRLTVASSCDPLIQREEAGPPLFMNVERNLSFNAVGLKGHRYIAPYVWDQRISNCALKLSETCGTDLVLVQQSEGFLRAGIMVNHTDGLQPYPPNQKCQWLIRQPAAKFISFTINYVSITEDSNDRLIICESDYSSRCSIIQQNNGNFDKHYKLMSSKAYIEFTTTDHVSFESRGWEIKYSTGTCDGKEDIYEHHGVISSSLYTSTISSYAEGLTCQWVLHGKPGTPVSLRFTHINITQKFDYLAIYKDKTHQIANFSGFYSRSDLPQMNLTGEVIIIFATQTDKGEGWSVDFNISSPISSKKDVWPIISIIIITVVAVSLSFGFIALAILQRQRKQIISLQPEEGFVLISLETGEDNQIAEGPSAMVYKADWSDGGFVAVKFLRDIAAQTQVQEEILLKSSSHPNIISLVGRGQDRHQRQYLVFEFMARGSLSLNLEEKGETLGWEKRLAIVLQICSAIQMLHMYLKPPAYHGNITSQNILLDESCNAKLGGFGAANYCNINRTNPEQLLDMSKDIWSLGLLLVELLRGKPLANRQDYGTMSVEEINDLVGAQDCLDRRLKIPREKCKITGTGKVWRNSQVVQSVVA